MPGARRYSSLIWLFMLLCVSFTSIAADAVAPRTIRVVAAESSYGSMVKAVGGNHVRVVSLLDSPSVNPHEFKATVRMGRALQHADLVVINGLGFDSWIEPLLRGTTNPQRRVIKASDAGSALVLADKNPHVFYSPRIMLATASSVAAALAAIDPTHRRDYQTGLQTFRQSLLPIYAQVQTLIAAHPNLTVTATVPVYAYMLRLLGYRDCYHDLQFASMDDGQPSTQQVRQFVHALQRHEVALLIYNRQVQSRLTQTEVAIAQRTGVPTVGVSAIPLHGEDYAQWQIRQLQTIGEALDHRSSRP